MTLLSICLLSVWGVYSAFPLIRLPTRGAEMRAAREALYLPRGEALELISFGYRNVLAQVLWFNTVLYFGYHVKTDRDYTWLLHMCELVTRLSPKMRHVYEFGGVMLAWEAHDPAGGVKMLDRAIERFPEYWRLYYLRGVLRLHFLKDDDGAREDFLTGSKLPDTIPIMAQMAAKKMTHAGNAEIAIHFLTEMIRDTSTEEAREALQRSLRDAVYDRDRIVLGEVAERYRVQNGSIPHRLEDLVQAGMLRFIPEEPYGGTYQIDPRTGEVKGTSEEAGKRLPLPPSARASSEETETHE